MRKELDHVRMLVVTPRKGISGEKVYEAIESFCLDVCEEDPTYTIYLCGITRRNLKKLRKRVHTLATIKSVHVRGLCLPAPPNDNV